MEWSKWVRDRLEESRGKPERPKKEGDYVEGFHDETGRSANFAWTGIAISSLASESPSMLLLDELDKRSPKR